mgnify:FL=1
MLYDRETFSINIQVPKKSRRIITIYKKKITLYYVILVYGSYKLDVALDFVRCNERVEAEVC